MFRASKAKLGSKMAMGTMAFAAPIFLGVIYTAGADIGADSSSNNTEDQWVISQDDSAEYTLDRTEVSGVVDLIVTDEQGNVVAAADYPDFVAEAAAEFGAENWIPEEDGLFRTDDGQACYDSGLLAVLSEDPGFGTISSSPEGTFALEVYPDGEIDKAFFDGEVSDSLLDAHRDAGGRYGELEGAKELGAC